VTDKIESPNKDIDLAIKKLLARANDSDKPEPTDVVVKVITAAIAWEKVKHGILDKDETFDPDQMDR
jgi:hypothetical protein